MVLDGVSESLQFIRCQVHTTKVLGCYSVCKGRREGEGGREGEGREEGREEGGGGGGGREEEGGREREGGGGRGREGEGREEGEGTFEPFLQLLFSPTHSPLNPI